MDNKKLILCDQDMCYTAVQIIEDGKPFSGGIEFIQSYPHMLLGHTTERVLIREDDIAKTIEFLNGMMK